VPAIRATLSAFAIGLCEIVCAAEPLPIPQGPVLLTISGAIEQTNGAGEARFDRAMLDALGHGRVKTTTPWTDGVKVFEGVPLRALLERVGAKGTEITASALNDYEAVIPMDDVRYGPILAMRMNGTVLKRADKGPLWVVYPQDQDPVLTDPYYEQRWVWQLNRLDIR
jgi:hypothetical protein